MEMTHWSHAEWMEPILQVTEETPAISIDVQVETLSSYTPLLLKIVKVRREKAAKEKWREREEKKDEFVCGGKAKDMYL